MINTFISLAVVLQSTFPNPSCYHLETAAALPNSRSHLFVMSDATCDASVSTESENAK